MTSSFIGMLAHFSLVLQVASKLGVSRSASARGPERSETSFVSSNPTSLMTTISRNGQPRAL